MHFCNDNFWEQLNRVTNIGAKFIFNITIPNSNWEMNNSYIKSNDKETEIFLEWIHNKPIKERIISKDEINNITNKYGWNINNCEINKINNLMLCYEWFFLSKI